MCDIGRYPAPSRLATLAAMSENGRGRVVVQSAQWGFFFFIAYIGAAVYFVSVSDGSFWGVVLGLLQAIVWPAYVVYHVLVLLHV